MPGKLNQSSVTLAWMRMTKERHRKNQLKIMVHACYCTYTTVQFDEEMCLTSFFSFLSPIHTVAGGMRARVVRIFIFIYNSHHLLRITHILSHRCDDANIRYEWKARE